MPPNEQDWARDRDRFVIDAERARRDGHAALRDHGWPLGPLAQQFAILTYSLLDADSVAAVLSQVVLAAQHVVAGADLVSVTLRSRDGQFHTPVRTAPLASELDELQYKLEEGPCLTAAEQNGLAVAVSDDLAADPRWPRFGPAAAGLGMASVVSTALLPDAQAPRLSGALNIYSRRVSGLDEADRDTALLLATHASLALARTEAVGMAELRAANLRKAIDSRDVIGQAKGILMGRRGMSAAEAFEVLRRTSQNLNVKLVELAETLTKRHTELDPPDTDG